MKEVEKERTTREHHQIGVRRQKPGSHTKDLKKVEYRALCGKWIPALSAWVSHSSADHPSDEQIACEGCREALRALRDEP